MIGQKNLNDLSSHYYHILIEFYWKRFFLNVKLFCQCIKMAIISIIWRVFTWEYILGFFISKERLCSLLYSLCVHKYLLDFFLQIIELPRGF